MGVNVSMTFVSLSQIASEDGFLSDRFIGVCSERSGYGVSSIYRVKDPEFSFEQSLGVSIWIIIYSNVVDMS